MFLLLNLNKQMFAERLTGVNKFVKKCFFVKNDIISFHISKNLKWALNEVLKRSLNTETIDKSLITNISNTLYVLT